MCRALKDACLVDDPVDALRARRLRKLRQWRWISLCQVGLGAGMPSRTAVPQDTSVRYPRSRN
jgi:hypothetical protein